MENNPTQKKGLVSCVSLKEKMDIFIILLIIFCQSEWKIWHCNFSPRYTEVECNLEKSGGKGVSLFFFFPESHNVVTYHNNIAKYYVISYIIPDSFTLQMMLQKLMLLFSFIHKLVQSSRITKWRKIEHSIAWKIAYSHNIIPNSEAYSCAAIGHFLIWLIKAMLVGSS